MTSPLERLQQLTERERLALVRGDWRGLQEAVAEKLELAEEVSRLGSIALPVQLLRRLREATAYNQLLASRLSSHLGELLGARAPGSTYTRAGRLPFQAAPALAWEG